MSLFEGDRAERAMLTALQAEEFQRAELRSEIAWWRVRRMANLTLKRWSKIRELPKDHPRRLAYDAWLVEHDRRFYQRRRLAVALSKRAARLRRP